MNFTLTTINIQGVPLISKNLNGRINKFISILKKDSPDILCVQEIWRIGDRKKILDRVKDYNCPKICLKESLLNDKTGGLCIFVKKSFNIESTYFHKFKNSGPFSLEDALARKGFLHLVISKSGKNFSVITTHLHMRVIPLYRERTRKRQLIEIEKYLKYIDKAMIFAGDMNFESDNELYERVINNGFVDTVNLKDEKQFFTVEGVINHNKDGFWNILLGVGLPRKLDYIFTKNGSDHTIKTKGTKLVFDLFKEIVSDHYGIKTNIYLD